MKSSRIVSTALFAIALFTIVKRVDASTVVYFEDFTSTTLVSAPNPYLGGWFTPQTAYQIWNGSQEASITTGALTVAPTNGTRSAGVILSPGLFPSAGTYTLSFDVTAYTGSTNNNGLVTVWAGGAYDLTNSTGNALILDTQAAELKSVGNATASSLGSKSITAAGSGQQITFNYDGSSAVALFFGASTNGWPFPTVTYDNITITGTSIDPIPEPSVTALFAICVTVACFCRRRSRLD